MMPGLDGFEVCKNIKQNKDTKDIKILILSAKSEQDNKIKGIDYGADDYLTKPFDPSEIDLIIESLLTNKTNTLKNKITGLNNKKALNEFLKEHKEIKNLIEISLVNFESYKEKNGKNNSEKLLKLLSRLFKDKIKDDLNNYIAHVQDDKFVIYSRISNIKKEIEESFNYILPYVYHKKDSDVKIKIEFKDISIRN